MGERRILDDVVVREEHHLAQFLPHPIRVALLLKETAQPLRRNVGGIVDRVDTLAGHRDGIHVDIRRKICTIGAPGTPAECSASSMASE